MSEQRTSVVQERPTGLEDVIRSVRALARTTRGLAESSADLVEREIALAVRISEGIRDRVVAKEALERARRDPLLAQLAEDAQRITRLATDAVSLVYVNVVDFVEGFADERRSPPTLPVAEARPVANG